MENRLRVFSTLEQEQVLKLNGIELTVTVKRGEGGDTEKNKVEAVSLARV